MMKLSIVLSIILASTILAADTNVEITKYDQDLNPNGSYAYDYAQSNGVIVEESGIGGQYVIGSYQYNSPDGQTIKVKYTADENGFHPEGEHLPTPPPVPEYILRSIEYIRSLSPQSSSDAGAASQKVVAVRKIKRERI